MNHRELAELLAFSQRVATEAGAILKRGFGRRLSIDYKGRIDPVTDYDLRSEQYIVSRINRAYPGHEILAEEGGRGNDSSEHRWVIDPLDGTVNYAHGFPIYCVSIALEYCREIVCGAVFDPERDELFSTGKGLGARLNRRKIHVSRERKLERALLATGFAYDIGTSKQNNLGLFARMAKQAQGIRRPGSAAIDLCWVASGRIDGFWELKLHPWDTAAAKLLIVEAGGRVSRVDGSPYSIYDRDLLASNGALHVPMMRVLDRH